MQVRIKTDGEVPEYAHEGDAAFDLRADDDAYIQAGEWQVIGTGISVEIPEGYAGLVLPRSGLATKQGLTVINSPGLVDSGYRGEVKVPLLNANRTVGREVRKGERIAQMMIVPFERAEFAKVDELGDSERGSGGFGSTGTE